MAKTGPAAEFMPDAGGGRSRAGTGPAGQADPEHDEGLPRRNEKAQVNGITVSAPPGTRTPDPLIKSQLL
jgi:hypothetical protein